MTINTDKPTSSLEVSKLIFLILEGPLISISQNRRKLYSCKNKESSNEYEIQTKQSFAINYSY